MQPPNQAFAAGGFAVLTQDVEFHLGPKQVVNHVRDERSGKQIGREHGIHDGHRQRREQVPGRASQHQHRHKYDADAKGGNKGGRRDLLGAIEHRAHERLLHGHVAMRVLDFDGGVIHEDADSERQPAERHDVDCLPGEAQHDDRNQNRKRNRDANDDGAAPASDEEQNHQTGETGGDDGFAQYALN